MKITISFWPTLRFLLVLLSSSFLFNLLYYHQYDKTYCGIVVEKKDWAREGSKGVIYQQEYIIMKWDNTNSLKRIDVNSETFFKLNIGSNACFDLTYRTKEFEEWFSFISILTMCCFLWWAVCGLDRVGIV